MTTRESSTSHVVLEYNAEDVHSVPANYAVSGWKGFVAESSGETDERPPVGGSVVPRDTLDMTSMVDVTFLLLIFFMVTASFAISKSMEVPTAQDGASAEPIDDLQQLTVFVDRDNTFYVSSPVEDIECPSEKEMWTQVREVVGASKVERLVVKAHVDSLHQKAVAAWDAGRFAGVEDILFETSEEEL